MVVKPKSPFTFSFSFTANTADVAPVVVAEEQCHIVGHGKSSIIITLHLGKDRPELRHAVLLSIYFPDNLPLPFYYLLQRLHIIFVVAFAHRDITIATHSYCHKVVVCLVTLHAIKKELVHPLLIHTIVPRSDAVLPFQIFLMCTHHRLMVGGSHHDAIFISQPRAFRIVLIESCRPHGRPQIVGLQAQQELKHMDVHL